jgi:hypothetical protein
MSSLREALHFIVAASALAFGLFIITAAARLAYRLAFGFLVIAARLAWAATRLSFGLLVAAVAVTLASAEPTAFLVVAAAWVCYRYVWKEDQKKREAETPWNGHRYSYDNSNTTRRRNNHDHMKGTTVLKRLKVLYVE